jgi:Uma2 family endonuclease
MPTMRVCAMAVAYNPRRFTVREYYAMGTAGVLSPDERVELLDGEILTMPPIGPRHTGCVNRLTYVLFATFGTRVVVQGQNPVRLDERSEPQPDIALLRPRDDFYASHHAQAADVLALIEVADTSMPFDRGRKLRAYARHGIADYWIVDLARDRVLVHRKPSATGYAFERSASRGETLAFEAFPDDVLPVNDLLPAPLD